MTGSDFDPDGFLREADEAWRDAHPGAEELVAYADGALHRFEEIRDHLEVCEECSELVEQLAAGQPEAPTPEQVELAWRQTEARFEAQGVADDAQRDAGQRETRLTPGRGRLFALAAAFVLLVVLASLVALSWRTGRSEVHSLERQLAAERGQRATARGQLQETRQQLAHSRQQVAELRQERERAIEPHANVPLLEWPTRRLQRGGPAPAEIPVIGLKPGVEQFVALLEDPSQRTFASYRLVVRDGSGHEVATVDDLQKTPYGNCVVLLSRQAFPDAQRLELTLEGVDDHHATRLASYAIRLH